jgi:hypothetical protein
MKVNSRSGSWFIAGALAATVLAAGVQVAAATSHSTIHACVAKSNGALRVAKHCTKHETALSWNSRGPAGKNGKNGKPGNNGQPGVVAGFTSDPGTPTTASIPDTQTYVAMASVSVPAADAGSYIVTGSTEITSSDATEAQGHCRISQPSGDSGQVGFEMPGTADIVSAYPTITTEADVSTGGATLTLECDSDHAVTAQTTSLSAVQVTVADH